MQMQKDNINSKTKKRKSRSTADARLVNNYLGSFKAEIILGNVERLIDKEQLFSVKESKWNFISDSKQVMNILQLEKDKKLKREDVQVNIINELCKNECNQDVIICYGNQSDYKYCLLRHKFSEMWRFPIYCNFLDLRIEVCDEEDEIRNILYDHINSQIKICESQIDEEFIGDSQQKLNQKNIIFINKFRETMKPILVNATKAECVVHVYLKQQFFTFPLNISKVNMEKGIKKFQEQSLNEQVELLAKDSLYLLLNLLKIPKMNKLEIPLHMKVPFMSFFYMIKMKNNMLNDKKKNILLFEQNSSNQNNENQINQLLDLEYLNGLEKLFEDSQMIVENKQFEQLPNNENETDDDNGDEELEDYDDTKEDELIYENQEQDGDTIEEEEERSNIEEGKNFKKTLTPTQMQKQFELKEYQKQGLTWMLHREQKIKRKDLYEQKQFILTNNINLQYGDITMAYEEYKFQQQDQQLIHYFYNPLNGHSCLDIEVEEEKNPIKGGILADQMGLGKTIMTISLILQSKFKDYLNEEFGQGGVGGGGSSSSFNALSNVARYAENTSKFYLQNQNTSINQKQNNEQNNSKQLTLIVVPKSLVRQWEKEIKQALSQQLLLQIFLYEKSQPYYEIKPIFKDKDIVITTYGLLASEYKNISKYLLIGLNIMILKNLIIIKFFIFDI